MTASSMPPSDPLGWGIIHLMGHTKRAGLVREVVVAQQRFIRVEVPTADGTGWRSSTLFHAKAIFSIDLVGEDAARVAAREIEDGIKLEPLSEPHTPDSSSAEAVG